MADIVLKPYLKTLMMMIKILMNNFLILDKKKVMTIHSLKKINQNKMKTQFQNQ